MFPFCFSNGQFDCLALPLGDFHAHMFAFTFSLLENDDVQWPLVRFTLVKRPFVMRGDDHILLLFVKICEQKAKSSTMQRSTISSFSKEIVATFFIGNLSPLHD